MNLEHKPVVREGEGQFNEEFVVLALDAANEIEGHDGFIMAYSDPENSDGRRSVEWMARMMGCIDPASI